MSPALTRVGAHWRLVAMFAVGALVLASCGTAKVAIPRLSGAPALSISVPLSNVGCTLNDVCVAVGTSSASVGPTSVGEVATPSGRWLNLTLPASTSPLITSLACMGTQCLLGGSQPGHDLLWRFSAGGDTLAVVTPPPGGIGINALSCNGLICALVDTSALDATPRFSFSADGGLTWTNPLDMTWASSDAITSISCGMVFDCVVGALSVHHQFSLYVTRDGGTTWTKRVTPSPWTALTSLSCTRLRCVALASTNTSATSKLVRSNNLGKSWTSVSLHERASALACTPTTTCVVVGQHSNQTPWLATVNQGATVNVTLRYVPTPLLNVACGSKVCAAIGVTTLLSVPVPK